MYCVLCYLCIKVPLLVRCFFSRHLSTLILSQCTYELAHHVIDNISVLKKTQCLLSNWMLLIIISSSLRWENCTFLCCFIFPQVSISSTQGKISSSRKFHSWLEELDDGPTSELDKHLIFYIGSCFPVRFKKRKCLTHLNFAQTQILSCPYSFFLITSISMWALRLILLIVEIQLGLSFYSVVFQFRKLLLW